MGSLTMALRANILLSLLSLLSLLATVTSHPGGYWWMGQDGAFGSQTNNNKIVDISPSPSPSGNDAGVGYYGNNNQPTEDFSSSSSPVEYEEDLAPSPSLPEVSEDVGGDLPVTECPVGWKCVSELFCDATATMVSQRVQLSKAQIAIRGNLIQCMNPATAQFNVCCRQPQRSSDLPQSCSASCRARQDSVGGGGGGETQAQHQSGFLPRHLGAASHPAVRQQKVFMLECRAPGC